MSFKYIENRVTREQMEEIKRRAKKSPKSHGFKFWMMRNHYGNLREYQQVGFHWFYLGGSSDVHCTCGLTVPRKSRVENVLGHRNLPSFEGVTYVFINSWEWRPDIEDYEYGAYCQLCKKGSLRNLSQDEVHKWITDHLMDCSERDKMNTK